MITYRLLEIKRLTVTRDSTVSIRGQGIALVIVDAGGGEARCGNSILDFGRESALILPAGAESTFSTSDYAPAHLRAMMVSREQTPSPTLPLTKFGDRQLEALSHDDVLSCALSDDDFFALSSLFRIIETEFSGRESFSNFVLDGLTLSLLMMISRRLRFTDPSGGARSGSAHVSLGESVLQAIRSGYGEPLTLTSLARRLGFSAPYLSRSIKRELNATFSELLTAARIGGARAMLEDTNDLVYDIAQACGYNDLSHFCYVFKKSEGVSPLAFRKRSKLCKAQR
jgi:AraC-like DNA-binding protein